MKVMHAVCGAVLTSLALGSVTAGEGAIDESSMGLSKTSVFDDPSPTPFAYSESNPGTNDFLPVAYPGAPPQISHGIEKFVPVTTENNQCVSCHDNPGLSEKPQKGLPTPMPESHYTDLRSASDKPKKEMIGSRYVCTQCHVPQAEVKPLVENTSENLGR